MLARQDNAGSPHPRSARVRRLTLHLVELPRIAARHANVARIPRLHDIMQRLHRLLDRRFIIEAVALEDVDIVELQALERRLDAVEDVLAAQAVLVDCLDSLLIDRLAEGAVHREEDLGEDDDRLAGRLGRASGRTRAPTYVGLTPSALSALPRTTSLKPPAYALAVLRDQTRHHADAAYTDSLERIQTARVRILDVLDRLLLVQDPGRDFRAAVGWARSVRVLTPTPKQNAHMQPLYGLSAQSQRASDHRPHVQDELGDLEARLAEPDWGHQRCQDTRTHRRAASGRQWWWTWRVGVWNAGGGSDGPSRAQQRNSVAFPEAI